MDYDEKFTHFRKFFVGDQSSSDTDNDIASNVQENQVDKFIQVTNPFTRKDMTLSLGLNINSNEKNFGKIPLFVSDLKNIEEFSEKSTKKKKLAVEDGNDFFKKDLASKQLTEKLFLTETLNLDAEFLSQNISPKLIFNLSKFSSVLCDEGASLGDTKMLNDGTLEMKYIFNSEVKDIKNAKKKNIVPTTTYSPEDLIYSIRRSFKDSSVDFSLVSESIATESIFNVFKNYPEDSPSSLSKIKSTPRKMRLLLQCALLGPVLRKALLLKGLKTGASFKLLQKKNIKGVDISAADVSIVLQQISNSVAEHGICDSSTPVSIKEFGSELDSYKILTDISNAIYSSKSEGENSLLKISNSGTNYSSRDPENIKLLSDLIVRLGCVKGSSEVISKEISFNDILVLDPAKLQLPPLSIKQQKIALLLLQLHREVRRVKRLVRLYHLILTCLERPNSALEPSTTIAETISSRASSDESYEEDELPENGEDDNELFDDKGDEIPPEVMESNIVGTDICFEDIHKCFEDVVKRGKIFVTPSIRLLVSTIRVLHCADSPPDKQVQIRDGIEVSTGRRVCAENIVNSLQRSTNSSVPAVVAAHVDTPQSILCTSANTVVHLNTAEQVTEAVTMPLFGGLMKSQFDGTKRLIEEDPLFTTVELFQSRGNKEPNVDVHRGDNPLPEGGVSRSYEEKLAMAVEELVGYSVDTKRPGQGRSSSAVSYSANGRRKSVTVEGASRPSGDSTAPQGAFSNLRSFSTLFSSCEKDFRITSVTGGTPLHVLGHNMFAVVANCAPKPSSAGSARRRSVKTTNAMPESILKAEGAGGAHSVFGEVVVLCTQRKQEKSQEAQDGANCVMMLVNPHSRDERQSSASTAQSKERGGGETALSSLRAARAPGGSSKRTMSSPTLETSDAAAQDSATVLAMDPVTRASIDNILAIKDSDVLGAILKGILMRQLNAQRAVTAVLAKKANIDAIVNSFCESEEDVLFGAVSNGLDFGAARPFSSDLLEKQLAFTDLSRCDKFSTLSGHSVEQRSMPQHSSSTGPAFASLDLNREEVNSSASHITELKYTVSIVCRITADNLRVQVEEYCASAREFYALTERALLIYAEAEAAGVAVPPPKLPNTSGDVYGISSDTLNVLLTDMSIVEARLSPDGCFLALVLRSGIFVVGSIAESLFPVAPSNGGSPFLLERSFKVIEVLFDPCLQKCDLPLPTPNHPPLFEFTTQEVAASCCASAADLTAGGGGLGEGGTLPYGSFSENGFPTFFDFKTGDQLTGSRDTLPAFTEGLVLAWPGKNGVIKVALRSTGTYPGARGSSCDFLSNTAGLVDPLAFVETRVAMNSFVMAQLRNLLSGGGEEPPSSAKQTAPQTGKAVKVGGGKTGSGAAAQGDVNAASQSQGSSFQYQSVARGIGPLVGPALDRVNPLEINPYLIAASDVVAKEHKPPCGIPDKKAPPARGKEKTPVMEPPRQVQAPPGLATVIVQLKSALANQVFTSVGAVASLNPFAYRFWRIHLPFPVTTIAAARSCFAWSLLGTDTSMQTAKTLCPRSITSSGKYYTNSSQMNRLVAVACVGGCVYVYDGYSHRRQFAYFLTPLETKYFSSLVGDMTQIRDPASYELSKSSRFILPGESALARPSPSLFVPLQVLFQVAKRYASPSQGLSWNNLPSGFAGSKSTNDDLIVYVLMRHTRSCLHTVKVYRINHNAEEVVGRRSTDEMEATVNDLTPYTQHEVCTISGVKNVAAMAPLGSLPILLLTTLNVPKPKNEKNAETDSLMNKFTTYIYDTTEGTLLGVLVSTDTFTDLIQTTLSQQATTVTTPATAQQEKGAGQASTVGGKSRATNWKGAAAVKKDPSGGKNSTQSTSSLTKGGQRRNTKSATTPSDLAALSSPSPCPWDALEHPNHAAINAVITDSMRIPPITVIADTTVRINYNFYNWAKIAGKAEFNEIENPTPKASFLIEYVKITADLLSCWYPKLECLKPQPYVPPKDCDASNVILNMLSRSIDLGETDPAQMINSKRITSSSANFSVSSSASHTSLASEAKNSALIASYLHSTPHSRRGELRFSQSFSVVVPHPVNVKAVRACMDSINNELQRAVSSYEKDSGSFVNSKEAAEEAGEPRFFVNSDQGKIIPSAEKKLIKITEKSGESLHGLAQDSINYNNNNNNKGLNAQVGKVGEISSLSRCAAPQGTAAPCATNDSVGDELLDYQTSQTAPLHYIVAQLKERSQGALAEHKKKMALTMNRISELSVMGELCSATATKQKRKR